MQPPPAARMHGETASSKAARASSTGSPVHPGDVPAASVEGGGEEDQTKGFKGAREEAEEEGEEEQAEEEEEIPAIITAQDELSKLPPSARARNLLGGVTAAASALRDERDREGVFFCFFDLAVRAEGRFCLLFEMMDLEE